MEEPASESSRANLNFITTGRDAKDSKFVRWFFRCCRE